MRKLRSRPRARRKRPKGVGEILTLTSRVRGAVFEPQAKCRARAADVVIVMAASPLARRLESSALWRRRQRQVSGAALIGLGGYVASRSNYPIIRACCISQDCPTM